MNVGLYGFNLGVLTIKNWISTAHNTLHILDYLGALIQCSHCISCYLVVQPRNYRDDPMDGLERPISTQSLLSMYVGSLHHATTEYRRDGPMDGLQGFESLLQPDPAVRLNFAQGEPISQMSEDRLCIGVDSEASDSKELDQLVSWLQSLEVCHVAASAGEQSEHDLEGSNPLPKGGLSKNRRRRKTTEFQKEYKKISQRERRQEKRRARRVAKGDANEDGDTIDYAMLWMVYVVHERDGSLRKKFPKSVEPAIVGTGTEQVLRSYLERHEEGDGMDFPTIKDLVDYVALKRSEVVSLRRRLNMLPKTEKHYEEKLRAIDARDVELRKGSTERARGMTKERFLAIHKLAVVRHAAVVLPLLLAQASGRLEKLIVKLNQGKEVEIEWAGVHDLHRELNNETERTQQLAKWIRTVFPHSGTYNEILQRFTKAQARATKLEAEYTKAVEDLKGKIVLWNKSEFHVE